MPSRREVLLRVAAMGGALAVPACRRSPGPARPLAKEEKAPGRGASSGSRGSSGPAYLALERSGVLKRREEELWAIFEKCELCPRRCGVNRLKGELGICRATSELRLASAAPHFGEERPLVGSGGSGTIFFSHCNLRCCFCQNWEINHRGDGRTVTKEDLARIMLALQERGCHNINLVTPSHVLPNIMQGLRLAIHMGLRLPLVYNTSAYDALHAVKALDGIVDIYLPDFKYQDPAMGDKYSAGAKDYPEVAGAAILEMHRQVGNLRNNPRGVAERGLIIRHLVMPKNVAGTDRFVKWVASSLGVDTAVNLMDQYHPAHQAHRYPDISRGIRRTEYQQAVAWARQAGLRNLQ